MDGGKRIGKGTTRERKRMRDGGKGSGGWDKRKQRGR